MRVPRWSVLIAACLVLTTVPAAAQGSSRQTSRQPQFTVSGDVRRVAYRDVANDTSLVWFPEEQTVLEIPEASYYAVQGRDVDGALSFDFSLETTSDQLIAASQIAFDEETGEGLLAVGVPTTPSVTRFADAASNFPSWVLQSRSGADDISATEVTTAATWQPGRGAFGTFWTDPVGITVSDVITEVRWEYNGTNVRYPQVTDVTYVLSANGWTQVSHARGKYLNAAKTVATAWTTAHHKTSSWFPSPTCGTTRVKYDANNAYGGKSGGIAGGVNTWAEGSCRGLLAVQAFVYRGQT